MRDIGSDWWIQCDIEYGQSIPDHGLLPATRRSVEEHYSQGTSRVLCCYTWSTIW